MVETADQQSISTEAEAKQLGSTDVDLWLRKVKAAKKDDDKWRESAKKAIEIYEASEDKQITCSTSCIRTPKR